MAYLSCIVNNFVMIFFVALSIYLIAIIEIIKILLHIHKYTSFNKNLAHTSTNQLAYSRIFKKKKEKKKGNNYR